MGPGEHAERETEKNRLLRGRGGEKHRIDCFDGRRGVCMAARPFQRRNNVRTTRRHLVIPSEADEIKKSQGPKQNSSSSHGSPRYLYYLHSAYMLFSAARSC